MGYWTYSFYTVILGNCREKLLCTTYKYLSLHWGRGMKQRESWTTHPPHSNRMKQLCLLLKHGLHILCIRIEWSSHGYCHFYFKNVFILSFFVSIQWKSNFHIEVTAFLFILWYIWTHKPQNAPILKKAEKMFEVKGGVAEIVMQQSYYM